MKKRILLLALVLISRFALYAQTPYSFISFLKNRNLAHASVSFKAIDLSTERIVVSHQDNMSLTPASNLKLVTTATALELLGSMFYFETSLLYDGNIQDNTLYGNLYIKGSGDPTLGSEFITDDKESFMREWLKALHNIGIRRITGNIIALDQLFGYEGVSRKWLWEDIGTHYAPGIYGINVFDNMYRIYMQSSNSDNLTTVLYTEPQINNLQITNDIKASGDSSDDASVFGLPFSNEMRLYGTIPAYQSSYVVKGAIPDPGLLLANYFSDFLRKNGIIVEGKATTYRLDPVTPIVEKIVSSVRSVDLASIIQTINVRSHNLYAEQLYKVLTELNSIDIQEFWRNRGLDSEGLFMYDGSGISPQNAISTGFLIDLLIYMYKKSGYSDTFYQSLPVAGVNGTVASFLRNTPLSGKARLKSGSISNVQSYSGYIENNGKVYVVSLIINNFTGERSDLQKEIERLFVRLF